MALADLLLKLEGREVDTSDTSCNPPEVSAKPAPNKACTLDTPDTSQNISADDWALFNAWLFHFTDRDDLPVTFAPAVDHAAPLAYYPGAVAAEPIAERTQRKATKAEAEEITALVQAIYANDTDDDQAEALAVALADPDGALPCYRTIAEDRGITIAAPVVGMVKACGCCQHLARPGKSEGYCGGRDDLPHAYGANHPLRRLPADRGASCDRWRAGQ
ncbi:hypothetical protein [Dechloromonas sp. H13]|uniref:hypothetical protein n=1 Tax=Dechloromonas sp. H13 TaxID=2570193 RepID=UPI00129135DA|nr:hypothetical protein [Dechloromonas sp. H13]